MTILFHCPWENAADWRGHLKAAYDEPVVGVSDSAARGAEIAALWRAPAETFADGPNLRLALSLGTGVDPHVLGRDPGLKAALEGIVAALTPNPFGRGGIRAGQALFNP